LEREGYRVTLVDADALKLKPEEIAPIVADADVVGLTAMTPMINSALTITRHLKKVHPELPVVLGGTHATLLPEETMRVAPEIDVLVKGEGEETIVDLLRAMETNQSFTDIPGISFRKDGKVVNNPPRLTNVDLDSLPFLAYHMLPQRKYTPHPPHGRAFPFAAIITSRGCPYKCSYCSKPIFGYKFRGQSPERVVEEIAYYKERFGVQEIAFYDDVFTLNKKRSLEIADGLIKKRLKIHWTCESRVNLVDKELLTHIKHAGCYAIAYGIESGSQDILNILDKDLTLEQIEKAVRFSREVGLQTIGYFMLGAPGETPETIRQTIQFAKKLKLDFVQFSIATPFPGTKLYDLYTTGKKGDTISWENFIYAGSGGKTTPVFESNLLNREDIQCWVKRAYQMFYLRPYYLWQRLSHITSFGDLKVSIRGLSMLVDIIKPLGKGTK
jgi:radical SAM superfamily enzyme YgiQ (UPF0313 family)